MSFVTDRMDLGYFPLQDYAAAQDGTPPGLRQAIGGVRVGTLRGPGQINEGDAAFVEIARDGGLGTLGDIHPWMFWQTRERSQRASGSWSQAFASVAVSYDIYYGESRTQPIRDAFMHNDTRYTPRQSYLAAGMPEIPAGAMVLTMAGTTEELQHPITMWADPRLIAPNTGGRGACGTLVVDTDQKGELCMGGSQTPGVGGRSARLQTLMGVIPVAAGASMGGLGFSPGNVIALNYGRTGIENIPGFGAVFGQMAGYGGPTTGSGGGGSQNGPVTGRGNGSGGGGAPQSANSSENRGRFSHATYNGPGAFGQGGFSAGDEERKPRDYGSEFTPNPNAGGTGLMASMTACGPIHLGSVGDKHRFGTDADGNPINSAHISTTAYYFQNQYADAPLEFSATPYPRNKVEPYPGAARVNLSYDQGSLHRHLTGQKNGLWRWWAEVPYMVPGGPTTGGPGRPPGGPPGGPGGPTTPGPGPGGPPGGPPGGGPPGGPTTPGGGAPGGPPPGPGGPTTPGPGGKPPGGQGKPGGRPGGPTTPRWPRGLYFPPGWPFGPLVNPFGMSIPLPRPKTPPPPQGVPGPTTPGPSGKGGKTYPQGGGSLPGDGEPGVDPGDGFNPDQPYGGGGSPTTPGGRGICNEADTAGLLVPWQDEPTNPPIMSDQPGGGSPLTLLRLGSGDRQMQLGFRARANLFAGTRRKDPRDTLGRWSGRNPWTREIEFVPGVVDHIGGAGPEARDLYTIFHPLHESFAALSFRPQLWVARYPHFERNPQVGVEMAERDEQRRPQVLAMRAWGAQNSDIGDWDYKESATSSRSRGGTANGGIMFAPPRFEGEDYFGIRSGENVEDVTSDAATRSYVLATPGVSFALGRPDLSGGLKTGGITITQAEPTADRALLIAQDGSELIKAYDDGTDTIVELAQGGTAAIRIPTGTDAQRPTTPASGMVRVNNQVSPQKLEFYDSSTSQWRSAINAQSTATVSLLTAESGNLAVDGDALQRIVTMRGISSGAVFAELFIDGASERAAIPSDSTWIWEARIVGMDDTQTDRAAYVRRGLLYNKAGATVMQGSVETIGTDIETNANWDVQVTADNTNDSLKIEAKGDAGQDVGWVVSLQYVQVSYT